MGRCLHALLALTSLVVACRGQDDQETRPLPAPEPSAPTSPLPLEPAAAPVERPRERPKVTKAEEPRDQQAPPPAPAPELTEAVTATPPAATNAAPAASAVTLPDIKAGCQQACQAGLQACLSQIPADPDGGTNLDALAACKRALDECKTKCMP